MDGALESSSDREGEISSSIGMMMILWLKCDDDDDMAAGWWDREGRIPPFSASSHIFTSCEPTKRFSAGSFCGVMMLMMIMKKSTVGSWKKLRDFFVRQSDNDDDDDDDDDDR